MIQCGGAECWETVTGLNWLQMVRNVERMLLGLTVCKWYSVVLRKAERLLLGLTGRKWYSVVLWNVESLILGLTGCKWCGMLRECY